MTSRAAERSVNRGALLGSGPVRCRRVFWVLVAICACSNLWWFTQAHRVSGFYDWINRINVLTIIPAVGIYGGWLAGRQRWLFPGVVAACLPGALVIMGPAVCESMAGMGSVLSLLFPSERLLAYIYTGILLGTTCAAAYVGFLRRRAAYRDGRGQERLLSGKGRRQEPF